MNLSITLDEEMRPVMAWLDEELQNAKEALEINPRSEVNQKGVEYAQNHLNKTRMAWDHLHDHPTVVKMRAVVAREMQHYQTDFYAHDLIALASNPYDEPFIWAVRTTGTFLIWVNITQKEWKGRQEILDYCRNPRNAEHKFWQGSLSSGLHVVRKPEKLTLRISGQ